jgi:HD-GYP domain-containing protein (c-di-GMP phosphodiesterase class II)
MPQQIKISADEIQLGSPIPWPAYDGRGRLQINKDTVINTQKQLDSMLGRGLYRRIDDKQSAATANPFTIINSLARRLGKVFVGLHNADKSMPEQVQLLAKEIQCLCRQDVDATLGTVHLVHQHDYALVHPIHMAILSMLLAEAQGYKAEQTLPLLAAALTCNISIVGLQSALQRQLEPPTAEQRKVLQNHPLRSARLLQKAGVMNPRWLEIVRQQHGLTNDHDNTGLISQQASQAAKILAVSNRYSAMLSPRKSRKALPADQASQNLLHNKGENFDESLSLAMIDLLGPFPPGCIVILNNGETAVVTKRPDEGMLPQVKSILTAQGEPLAEPLSRDCSDEQYGIDAMHTPEQLPSINFSALWGY